MKKIFYLASIAALAFSSCAKDETTEAQIGAVNGGTKITAAVEADDTRTSLEKVDGKYEFRWSAGDQLGVYGVGGGLNNAAFVLNNNSDGQAVGVFASQSTELKADGKYIAVYPRFQTSLFSATDIKAVKWPNPADADADDVEYPNYEAVKVNIPAVQKYQPETFYTQTVPAVSTTFVVGNDNAEVSMQPVVDYLFVNITSTEPISKLKLELRNASNVNIPIAGEGYLEKYILNKEYRYALKDVSGSNYITLEMDEASDAVTCHTANTYVFAVPAGIFGMGKDADIRARITVNDDTNPTFIITSGTGDNCYTNKQLNYYVDNKGTASTADDVEVSRYDASKSKWVSRQENTVFWANALDKNGNRTAFEYNPNNDYIIEHEGQLLKYLTEYNNSSETEIYRKDAFICSEHVFDFSLQNMRELTTELKANGSYNDYQVYISNYLADSGTFPCIQGVGYVNEFKGNGAVITDIERPLQSTKGIFNKIMQSQVHPDKLNGIINNVTFSGIVAATDKYVNYAHSAYVYVPGNILGTLGEGGKLIDVTVKDAQGMAILESGNVAAYEELTVKGAEGLNFIITDMAVEKNFTPTNWSDVTSAKMAVFGAIDATGHKILTLPAGAAYGDIAQNVSTEIDAATLSDRILYQLLGYPASYYRPIEAEQADNNVLSVMIGGESYWTGDKTNWTMDLPKKVGGTGADKDYYKLEYAEQLAMGADADNSARVMNNMHLESAVNPWEMVTVKHIDGNNKTISGVYMNGLGLDVVAPVDAEVVTNLVVDGVTLDLVTAIVGATTYVVPSTIAGLAVDAKTVTNVTVKNLVIDAYAYDGTNNTEAYYGDEISHIGWLVAEGTDIYVTNSKVEGVDSNVRGIAGLVGHITLKNAAQIDNSSATVKTMAQTALTAFAEKKASHKNVAGTAVGLVTTNATSPKDIKFKGIGKPVFLYDTTTGITVVYDNVESKTYKNWGY